MAKFPVLRTGAVAQYGSGRMTSFRTQVIRFLDGTEQSYRLRGSGQRRWLVRADFLDEGELGQLEQFFQEQQAVAGHFEFEDPEDGHIYTDCSFESDELRLTQSGPQGGTLQLIIRENQA